MSHTAIVENKRLGQALALVKAQQDLKLTTKVMTNSEKTGYKKNPRAIYGPDFVEKTRLRAAVGCRSMESMEDRTMKLSCLPPFPQTLETAKQRRFPHYAPQDGDEEVRLTFLLCTLSDSSALLQHANDTECSLSDVNRL